ncbi:MAG: hypothetical protein KBC81_02805 [Candidatus Pacebacteria bacterium]|nr:hypothetical protein [Candidatus Paceibacterota bacterium]
MNMEINEPQSEKQLYEAKLKSAQEIVDRAEIELSKAEGDQVIIWTNRVEQAKQEVERIKEEHRSKGNIAA